MTASLLMNPHPSVLHKDELISAGMDKVMNHHYRNIPVVDDNGIYLGIFGVHCLLRMVLPKAVLVEGGLNTAPFVSDTLKDLRQRLKDVENKPVTYCLTQTDVTVVGPDTPLVETLLAVYHSHAGVPVVDPENQRLLGMISFSDVGHKILEQTI